MPRLLQGVVGLLSSAEAVTHEGAVAFDLRVDDPLQHLAFTQGAALLERTYYRTQAEEIRSYAQALLAAERAEPGFGWKFAAYMRDPERGKGNRIQGSVAPAILGAADPTGPFTEEYTYRCLRQQSFRPLWGKGEPPDPLAGLALARPLDPRDPPLLALLKLWRETLDPIDVVLWNLAAYDASPAPSGMDHVLMLSGFDANSFAHVRKWQESGSQRGRPGKAEVAVRDPHVELNVIRTF